MTAKKLSNKKPFSITSITIVLTILYIVLFEFTLVTQSLFPKPSLLFESFISLWSEYNLLNGFFETTAIIFPAILVAILVLEIGIKMFLSVCLKYNGIKNISAPFKYFSFFFFALLINMAFPESLLAEFIFATIFILGKLFGILSKATDLITEEYIHTAKSLGLSKGEILTKVLWKNIKPNIYNNLSAIHTQTWVVVIIYEFIGMLNGVGSIYKIAFDYNDLSAIFALGIFIALVILVVNLLIKAVVSKLIFWK